MSELELNYEFAGNKSVVMPPPLRIEYPGAVYHVLCRATPVSVAGLAPVGSVASITFASRFLAIAYCPIMLICCWRLRAAKPFLDDAGLPNEVHVYSNRRHGRSGTV